MADRRVPSGADVLAGRCVLIAGVGVAGASAARALLPRAARVLLTATTRADVVDELVGAGADWLGAVAAVPPEVDLVVASPGLKPADPLLADAGARGIEVWGEAELAWRLRPATAAPWLAITGTNGKTTTVHMLESILRAAGRRAIAVGNVGVPMIDAVLAEPPYEVLAVELSSQQLHSAPSLAPAAGALLNLAEDHLDWHGSFAAYAAAKAQVWAGDIAVGNLDDPHVAGLLAEVSGRSVVGFTLGEPAAGELGVLDGRLVSRALGDDGVVLASVAEVRPPGAHNVANALAAAALALAVRVPPGAIAEGLRTFAPDPHRNQFVLEHDGVAWVDDSKATNPHAALASLRAYDPIVWVAGGQLKGVDPDDLVAEVAPRLRGAVLLGADRAVLAAALERHAPQIPVIQVDSTDDRAMPEVVRVAATIARPGDTVLLAPAAASYDMFAGYGARGDAFAAAARALTA
jgi:UDP-N-acetylmuramoylalanine--D-glutamate ligase